MLEVCIEEIRTEPESELVQSCTCIDYTRERVKREEKEILQHQATSLNIHFVCHPRIIPHAPLYHLNIQPWSYTPPSQLLSVQARHIIQRRNTSNHFLIITYYTATSLPYSHAIFASIHISSFQ